MVFYFLSIILILKVTEIYNNKWKIENNPSIILYLAPD